jgi:hypothetical protein
MAKKKKTEKLNKLALRTLAPILFGAIVLYFTIFAYAAKPPQTHKLQYSPKKVVVTRKIAPPKVPVKPSTPTPVASATPAVTPSVVKVTTPVSKPKITTSSTPAPVVTPSPDSNVSSLTPSSPSTPASSPPSSPPSQTSGYTSTNWSGYLGATGTYTEISGSWRATAPSGNGSSTSADATWIGIGGVSTSDLIQIGTQNIVSASGKVSEAAFWELLPDVSQNISTISVSAGDLMSASITETSTNQWAFSITDESNSESYTSNVPYTSSHSSAEWIEEDPSFASGRQIPFDNFGTASFTNASALQNGSNLNLLSMNAQPITMLSGRNGTPVATPSSINPDGTSFSVTHS